VNREAHIFGTDVKPTVIKTFRQSPERPVATYCSNKDARNCLAEHTEDIYIFTNLFTPNLTAVGIVLSNQLHESPLAPSPPAAP
jgi:hypothetical protein